MQASSQQALRIRQEVLPKFLEDLNAAGIDKVVAEKQTQLDAWLAEQAG